MPLTLKETEREAARGRNDLARHRPIPLGSASPDTPPGGGRQTASAARRRAAGA
jgi:hypothetical protein